MTGRYDIQFAMQKVPDGRTNVEIIRINLSAEDDSEASRRGLIEDIIRHLRVYVPNREPDLLSSPPLSEEGRIW